MAFVIKFVKGVRTHWKKSTLATLAITYAINYTNEYYQRRELMRIYCLEAKKYGATALGLHDRPKRVTVILNPNANRRKTVVQFEKYCAPILHLAGMCVEIVKTESEGHARTLVEQLDQADAIIVAGGDGTVSEVVTGLMRRGTSEKEVIDCPIGVLPLGRTNTLASVLFPKGETLQLVRSLAEASMAIVHGNTTLVDVMKLQIIDDSESKENTETKKPVYAVSSIEWGAYRDAHVKRDKYWYFGSLRKYATYIFNGYKSTLSWECKADLNYHSPCDGCSNCYVNPAQKSRRWWYPFMKQQHDSTKKDYSKVTNPECAIQHNEEINTSDLRLMTRNVSQNSTEPQLNLKIGPYRIPYIDFVSQGWSYENGGNRKVSMDIPVRQIEIFPKNVGADAYFSIDKEDYEVKPIRVTLLPKILKVFCQATDV